MTSIAQIGWSKPLLPPAPTEAGWRAQVRRDFGYLPPGMEVMALCPWFLRLMKGTNMLTPRHFEARLGQLVTLVVSQDNSCRYCYGSARASLRLTGFSEHQIDTVLTDLHRSDLPPRWRAALEYVRLLSQASPRPGVEEVEVLRRHGFSDLAIGELAMTGAQVILSNRCATLTALAPDKVEGLVDRWFTPIAKVGIRLFLRLATRVATVEPLPPELNGLPFEGMFRRLEGVPQAAIFARALIEALSSEILPTRTKLLVSAVVARSLACTTCETSSTTALHALGLPADRVDEVLRNLASPILDDLERVLIPVARETVRYRNPAVVQERMRDLRGRLTAAEFLEFIGVVALANALARLTVVLSGLP